MKTIDSALIAKLKEQASQSPRLRANHNLHTSFADTSRFLNVGTDKTYWRPHKHENPDKWETMTVLEGQLGVLILRTVEIEPREWHTLVSLTPYVAIFETKQGPYVQETDKVFAPWSPEEAAPGGQAYLQKLKRYF